MCGRFTLSTDLEKFAKTFAAESVPAVTLTPRYNVCPTQTVAIIPNAAARRIISAKWGLQAPWGLLTNARAEGIADKPAFRKLFRSQRCVVAGDGFYEWKKEGKAKVPHHFRLKSKEVFGFAGLWEGDGDLNPFTCTLITTTPNSLVAPVHDRMPVILQEKFVDMWLSPDDQSADNLKAALVPYPASEMEGYAVSSFVSKAGNDSPQCIVPV